MAPCTSLADGSNTPIHHDDHLECSPQVEKRSRIMGMMSIDDHLNQVEKRSRIIGTMSIDDHLNSTTQRSGRGVREVAHARADGRVTKGEPDGVSVAD